MEGYICNFINTPFWDIMVDKKKYSDKVYEGRVDNPEVILERYFDISLIEEMTDFDTTISNRKTIGPMEWKAFQLRSSCEKQYTIRRIPSITRKRPIEEEKDY